MYFAMLFTLSMLPCHTNVFKTRSHRARFFFDQKYMENDYFIIFPGWSGIWKGVTCH